MTQLPAACYQSSPKLLPRGAAVRKLFHLFAQIVFVDESGNFRISPSSGSGAIAVTMTMFLQGDSIIQARMNELCPRGTVVVLAFTCVYFFWYIWSTYWTLKDVPGPWWAKFTNLQRVWIVKSGRSHKIHQRAHEKYGDLVRLGPNMVSVSDPSAIPVVYPMRPGFPKVRIFSGL